MAYKDPNDYRKWLQRTPEKTRRRWMKYRWGITPEEYDKLVEAQDGRCAIGRRHPKKIRLAIDHKHGTNQIRGLLCYQCNRTLGHLEKNKDRFLAYLEGCLSEQTVVSTLRSAIRPRR